MSTSADREAARARKRAKVPSKERTARAGSGRAVKGQQAGEAIVLSTRTPAEPKRQSKDVSSRAVFVSGKLDKLKALKLKATSGRGFVTPKVSGLKDQLETALQGQPDAAIIELVSATLMHASERVRALKAPIEGALRAAALASTIQDELLSDLVMLGNDEVTQARLAGEAKHSLLSEHEVLTAAEVSTLLGSHSANPRQFANTKRKQGEILGVPVANYYAYPAFQFDRARRRVFPEIAPVNELLRAEADPFGVFSWWVSPNTRIDARAPYQLLGTADADVLKSLAEAIVEPVG